MKNLNQKGFHLVGLVLILAVFGIVGFVGYRVLNSKESSSPSKSNNLSKSDSSGLVSDGYPLECVPRGHDNYRTNNTLAVDPSDANTVYVGIEYKGVYKSIDGGETWKQSDMGIRGYPKQADTSQKCVQELGRIVIDPRDNSHLLVSRVESPGDLSTKFSENAGVWESTDAGATWNQLIKPGMNASGSRAIAFDTKDSKVIYHGTNNMQPSFTGSDGNKDVTKYFNKDGILYKTSNGGKSWAELPTGAPHGLRAVNVSIDPINNSKIWLFTFSASEEGGMAPVSQQKAMLVSTDGGKTWVSLADKLPADYRIGSDGIMSPKDGNNVFVMLQNPNGMQKSFYTLDGGSSWSESNVPITVADFDPNETAGHRLLGVAPYSNNPGIYSSTNGGKTWAFLAKQPSDVDGQENGVRISGFSWSRSDKNTVYMSGSSGHVWKSTDNGKTWSTVLTLDKIGGPNKNKAGSTKSSEQDQ